MHRLYIYLIAIVVAASAGCATTVPSDQDWTPVELQTP
jgi:hypothetical protein